MSKSEDTDVPFEDQLAKKAGAAKKTTAAAKKTAAPKKAAATAKKAAEKKTAEKKATPPKKQAGKKAEDQADKPAEKQPEEQAEQQTGQRTEQPASEERTPPRPSSTGPTTMREDLGTLAEEGRKLWEALEARIVAPAIRSYPEVARHLGAAGREVAAAFRSAVRGQEQVWRDSDPGSPDGARQQEKITVERVDRIDPPEKKNRD